ncbi:MAG: hypothetical protein WBQ25_04185 [Nitrososphaeraceae archaeon]|jgi:hypothetical protein
MEMSTNKTILYNRDTDIEDSFPEGKQVINDYEDGNVIVDFFSRHNTLEEYIKLLNETSKK